MLIKVWNCCSQNCILKNILYKKDPCREMLFLDTKFLKRISLITFVVRYCSGCCINHPQTLFLLICQHGIPPLLVLCLFYELWNVWRKHEKTLIHNVIITFQFIVQQLPSHIYNKEFQKCFVNYRCNLCVRLDVFKIKNGAL